MSKDDSLSRGWKHFLDLRLTPDDLIDLEVLVVGAGVVGLTTAILLASQGYDLRVVFL